jgi:hypothetical protein
MNSPTAKEKRKKNQERSKKNKMPPHLGLGGYKARTKKWRQREQEAWEAGRADPLEGCSGRSRNW